MYENQAQNNIKEQHYISLQKLGENKFVRWGTNIIAFAAGIVGAYKIAKIIDQSYSNEVDAADTSKNLTNIVQCESLTQEEINKQKGIIEDPNFIPPEDKITKGLYFEGDNLIFWKEISGYKKLEDTHGKFWFPYKEKEQTVVKAGKDGKLNPELSSEDARNLAKILYDYWVSPENKAKSYFQTKTDLGKILRDTYGIGFPLPEEVTYFKDEGVWYKEVFIPESEGGGPGGCVSISEIPCPSGETTTTTKETTTK